MCRERPYDLDRRAGHIRAEARDRIPWESKTAMKEHDVVVLTKPFEDEGLVAGDVGAIVHVYADGEAFEVEFVASDGTTIALLTVDADEIRPRDKHEILHVRQLTG